MAMDYTTLWEAFLGGQGWGAGEITSAELAPGESTAYSGRVESFYNKIIGPAFGYYNPQAETQGFGEALVSKTGESLFGVGQERTDLDLAERQFRLAIGDPYGADDPFAWENISRYKTYGNALDEARQLLGEELYTEGELLGGETGSEYARSMATDEEGYTTGITGQRELLSGGREGLVSGAALASGTSGAVLRSSGSQMHAEDVLSEAYKKSRNLGSEYSEGKVATEGELRKGLDAALKTYLDAIDTEKSQWFDAIMSDVQRISGLYGTEEFEASERFGSEKVQADFELLKGESDWGGLEYTTAAEEAELRADPNCWDGGEAGVGTYICATQEAFDFRADGACGIGELWDPTGGDGTGACVAEGGLIPNEYGELIGTGEGFEAMYGCMNPDDCNYNPNAIKSDASKCAGPPSVECWDLTVVCSADECSEAPPDDCAGTPGGSAIIDQCGICDGDGQSCLDECGVVNGDNLSCADCCGVPNGAGDTCDGDCGPCGAGKTKECTIPGGSIRICPDEICQSYHTEDITVHCPDGTITTGNDPFDYSNCAETQEDYIEEEDDDPLDDFCDDGSIKDAEGKCPEDYEGGTTEEYRPPPPWADPCPCQASWEQNPKYGGSRKYLVYRDCNGNPCSMGSKGRRWKEWFKKPSDPDADPRKGRK